MAHHESRITSHESRVTSHVCYIGIGSNLGDRVANCERAIERLANDPSCTLLRVSPWYETEAMAGDRPSGQPSFVNGAAAIATSLGPQEALALLLEIERTLGRQRPSPKGTPRTVDLDLLLYDELILDVPGLTIPHPELAKRSFVLIPLCAIAPALVHPVFRKTMQELERRCQESHPCSVCCLPR